MLFVKTTAIGVTQMQGIVSMEHVNVTMPDQGLAALFYVSAMGFTRDPYVDFDDWNMWINVGREQFHTPKGDPQVFRGEIGIRVPCLEDLERRLSRLSQRFEGSRFSSVKSESAIRVTCPWGNRLACHEARAGEYPMGIESIGIQVPETSMAAIAHTYESLLGTQVRRKEKRIEVPAGPDQTLVFEASDEPPLPYDGHHLAIYIDNFEQAFSRFESEDLINAQMPPHEFRFVDFRGAGSKEAVWQLEHEVRSLNHPMFGRDLVNRNPANTLFNYTRGREALASLIESS